MTTEADFPVTIECRDAGHAPKVPRIAFFVWEDPAGWDMWSRSPEAHQTITPDGENVDRYSGLDWVKSQGARDRYRLACKLCGINVTLTPEKLFPVLDKLRLADVRVLDLIALARYSKK